MTTVSANAAPPPFIASSALKNEVKIQKPALKARDLPNEKPNEKIDNNVFLEKLDEKIGAHKDFITQYIDRKVDDKSDEFYTLYKKRVDALRMKKKPVTALATDTSAFSSDTDGQDATLPRTARLWTNLITRSCGILPLSIWGAALDKDNMTTGETFVSAILWPSEDVPALIKRYRDIKTGMYREAPLPDPKIKREQVKNPKEAMRFGAERVNRFWNRYGLTEGAIRTTLPFVAFDAIALTHDRK